MSVHSVEFFASTESRRTVTRMLSASAAQEANLPFPNGAYLKGPAARWSGSHYAMSLLGLLFVFTLLASLFWFDTLPTWQAANELVVNGRIAEARVESRRAAQDREGNTSYHVTYRFWANETASYHSREQRVSRDTYERLQDEAPVNVRYLPSDVDRSTLAEDRTEITARTIAAGLNVAAAIAVLIGLVVVFEKWHQQNTRVRRGLVPFGQLI